MKIIIFKSKWNFEPLRLFAEQIADGFLKLDYEVFIVENGKDFDALKTVAEICEFTVPNQTMALFFDNMGLQFEIGEKGILWNLLKIDCYSMLFDHPMFFHEMITYPIEKLTFFCVDKFHQIYIERFYQKQGVLVKSHFIPLGGSKDKGKEIAFRERSMDLVFVGRKHRVSIDIEELANEFSENVSALWKECYQLLLTCKTMTIEEMVEACLKKKGIQLTEEDLRDTIRLFKDMDLILRSATRANVLKMLADNDIKVHVYGTGWEDLDCKQKNLVIHELVSFQESIRLMADARISLNVMPWFKDGAHERVYTAMLNKSVCLTDYSKYLDETLTDGENVIMYSLDALEDLPQKVKYYLDHPKVLEEIAQKGYEYAEGAQDWTNRARWMAEIIEMN
ncbi:glycosyltransferase [Lachnospiraceae bacterium ZAX-1]